MELDPDPTEEEKPEPSPGILVAKKQRAADEAAQAPVRSASLSYERNAVS